MNEKKLSAHQKNISAPRKFSILLCLLLTTQLAGCRTLPDAQAAIAQPSSTIRISDDAAPAVRRSVKAVAAEVENRADATLQRHLGAMAAIGGPALIADNRVRLLKDGPQTYDAMFSAMDRARDHINMEVYILQDDEIGHHLAELLLKKRRQGVHVNLIYDSLGSLSTPREFFQALKDGGVRVLEYNPVNPIKGKALDLNNRDHRKLLIVDGEVGFTGGINISDVYSHGSAPGSSRRRGAGSSPRESGWRDTQIEVRGPAVHELQKIFFATWNRFYEAGSPPSKSPPMVASRHAAERMPSYYPAQNKRGDDVVQVIASAPGDDKNIIYMNINAAIRQARHSIHLTMAYFSPDRNTIKALQDAAARGVDVVLVLPGFSDVWLIFEAGRSHYSALLKSGVKIYERKDALLHAKTAVIDGVWSTVGSSNMDMRSFLHNTEVNVVVVGSDFGADMEAMFESDVALSAEVAQQSWGKRPLTDRMRQWFSRLWAYWL